MRTQHRLLVLLAMFSVPLASSASVLSWEFDGYCTDCAAAEGLDTWPVRGELKLRDYVFGNSLTADNFVSFEYSGSNLVSNVYIDEDVWNNATNQVLNGVLFADPLGSSLQLRLIRSDEVLWSCTDLGEAVAGSNAACSHTDRVFFSLNENGEWKFGAPVADVGGLVPVPEPATTLLLGAGLLGLGLRQRRASKRS